jgi:glycosyltransferase involved in cell wall biosynthesis
MKKILYIGNRLNTENVTVTSIDTLGLYLENEGYAVKRYSSKKNKFARLFDMCLAVFKNSSSTDIILIDTYSTQNFYYAFFVACCSRIVNIPYLPILRGGDLPKRLRQNKKICNYIFKNAHLNISPSLYLLKAFEEFGYHNTIYIPNTIELKNYTFLKRPAEPKLLWVRSFSEIYNPILALKVVEKLLPDFPQTSLCMVGPEKDGSLKQCKAYAKKYDLPVTFTGKLEKEDWIKLSENYSIFINTTNFDNTPVSVIEVMALGLPVISTNVGGIPFLLEDDKDALLVEPENVTAFADAVRKILQQPEMAVKRAIKAREKAETFDWEKVKLLWKKILS